jgi:hypothetical protein
VRHFCITTNEARHLFYPTDFERKAKVVRRFERFIETGTVPAVRR